MPAPMDILGMNAIPLLFPLWIPYKQLKNIQTAVVALSSVSTPPVKLPFIPPSFTKQYAIKGGHNDITLSRDYLRRTLLKGHNPLTIIAQYSQ
jgi:hypothetical protein